MVPITWVVAALYVIVLVYLLRDSAVFSRRRWREWRHQATWKWSDFNSQTQVYEEAHWEPLGHHKPLMYPNEIVNTIFILFWPIAIPLSPLTNYLYKRWKYEKRDGAWYFKKKAKELEG